MSKEVLEEFDPLSTSKKENKGDDEVASKEENVKPLANDNGHESNRKSTNINTSQSLSPMTNAAGEEEEESTFFDFQLFIKQLKDPHAAPIIKYIKSFLHSFRTQRLLWTASEQTKLINDFKQFIYGKFTKYEPFKKLNEVNFKNAQEGLEKLIMGKLYSRCFAPLLDKQQARLGSIDSEHENDLINDKLLQDKINEFKFISLENLDISLDDIQISSTKLNKFISLASTELNKINKFKAPRDKIVCILNCCKVIFGLLKLNKLDSKGADSFIPILIYVIIKSDIDNLCSNVKYIERFRYASLNRGEELYYLSSIQGAIEFIQRLTMHNLSIVDTEQFNKDYNENKIKIDMLLREKEENELKRPELDKVDKTHINSNTALSSLDEVTNSMVTLFTDFLSSYSNPTTYSSSDNSKQPITLSLEQVGDEEPISGINEEHQNNANEQDEIEEEIRLTEMINQLEEKENKETLSTLQSMFPDMDPEIIQDICIAKKYRVGECVDALLSLFD